MDISIQQLRMFRELSRQGTIASAADRLGYTPSAVSQQLSAAERSTGIDMLDRVGRNVFLTDAGHELVTHAEIILEQLEKAQAALERVQGRVSGIVHLGFIESVSSTMLGPIMTKLRADHPELSLHTRDIEGANPEELIRSGELHAGFVVGGPSSPVSCTEGFDRILICRDWFRLVVHSSRFAGAEVPESVALGSLVGEPFILPPPEDTCGQVAARACSEAGLDPYVVHSVADFPTSLRLVAADAGFALIPDLGLVNVPDDVVIVDIAEPVYRSVALTFRSSSAERPALKALVDTIEQIAQDMDLDRSS